MGVRNRKRPKTKASWPGTAQSVGSPSIWDREVRPVKTNWSLAAVIAMGVFIAGILLHYTSTLYFENLELKNLNAKQQAMIDKAAAEYKKYTEELDAITKKATDALAKVEPDWANTGLPESVRGVLEALSGGHSDEAPGSVPAADKPSTN